MVPAATVTTDAKPHGQQQLARDLEVERAVMGQSCRPQSFGEVQRRNPLCFLLTEAQYCCSWASLTDQRVRKFKDSLGINMTMKKLLRSIYFRTRTDHENILYFRGFLRSCQAARTAANCTSSLELDYENVNTFLPMSTGPRL